MPPLAAWSPLGGGLFLGWALGANDASNVFGTAVATRIIPFRIAALMCAAMVVLGAVLQGGAGIKTLSGISEQTVATAAIVSTAAALTGAVMTVLGLPISTSQAMVGAILGVSLSIGRTDYSGVAKLLLCWVGTPIGSLVISCVVYETLGFLLRRLPVGLLLRDRLLWAGLIVAGLYGSFALGANNVANTTGIFSGLLEGVTDEELALIGGIAIASGVLTYSRRVMMRVGGGIMQLDAFTALVAVLSMSITVHVFAMLGAPVSSSQGIVAAILGIGLLRGVHTLHFRVLREIVWSWLLTPVAALILAAAGYAIFL